MLHSMRSLQRANKAPQVRVLLDGRQIGERVAALAQDISRDYQGQTPVLVGVLKGSFVFLADLVRQLTIPVNVDFVRLGSYGEGTQTSGRVEMLLDVTSPLQARHVLVVEDIVDTGLSLSYLLQHLGTKGPASLKVCALLDKPARRHPRFAGLTIDYLGFTIPDEFVVGYGLDYAEDYRYLPHICVLDPAATDSGPRR